MKSVVVVGSGFTGFECARRLAGAMRRQNAPVEVTLVSPIDYMLYTPLLPDVAGGVADARFVTIPLAGTLKGARAVRRRVDDVDLDGHTLTFTDPEQRTRSMSWDRLVLTPGSVTRLFDIPGLATHARGLKSTAEALYLRDHVLEQFELAGLDDDKELAQARRTIVVVGASYSGTELVTQLRALADAAAKQMGFDPESVKFLLLDLAEQVMPEVGEKLSKAAMDVLRSRGIDVRLGTTLKEVHADHVVLTDDSVVGTHTVAWLTGVTGAPLIEQLGLPTEKGRLKVQADLQVPGHPDVFAAGDAAAVPDLTQPGKITPPTAQHATRQGKVLARNVAASLGYGTKKDYRHGNMGLVVDLGPHYAVANPLNIHLKGYAAKVVTRAYHLYAMPRSVNRWAMALAYLTDAMFPRTVVSLGFSSESAAEFSASEESRCRRPTDPMSPTTEELIAAVEQSPRVAAACDRSGRVGLFTDDGFVEDPVGAGRHVGHTQIGRFCDTFIGPRQIIFHRDVDIVSGTTVDRDVTLEIQMAPDVRLMVPTLIRYDLQATESGWRIASLRA